MLPYPSQAEEAPRVAGDCKRENGVFGVTITLTDRVTTECFRADLNLESNTFPCTA